MTTLLDVITDSLLDLGVLQEGETPNSAQSDSGLRSANNLLDQWKAENLLIYTITRATATLTASQASFTVGTGGNINIPRPGLDQIDRITFVDTAPNPDLELSLGPLLTEAEYQAIAQKALTATYPISAYYNPTFPTGTLYPWPIPTSSTLLWAVYYRAPVAEFTAPSDTVSLPPGYRRMLIKNIALEMAPSFGRQVDPGLVRQAMNSMAIVKRSNQRAVELTFDTGALAQGDGWFNIRSGS